MATALEASVMTLGPSPQKINSVLSNTILINGSSPKHHSESSISMLDTSSQHDGMSSASSTTSSSSSSSSDLVRCKRRINFQHLQYAIPHAQPVAVARRNARERNRVKQVNNGFSTLRQHIPFTARNKKMSKVETLRCAVEYIRGLQQLLDEQQIKNEQQDVVSTVSPVASPQPEELPQHRDDAIIGLSSDHGYYSSPETVVVVSESQYTQQTQMFPPLLHHLQPASLSPPCSAPSEPASSPTPSYESEASSYHQTAVYEPPVQAANYDNYQPMSPEDEELLDVISWWQQSQ